MHVCKTTTLQCLTYKLNIFSNSNFIIQSILSVSYTFEQDLNWLRSYSNTRFSFNDELARHKQVISTPKP